MKISGTKIEKIQKLRSEGKSYAEIAKQTKVSRSSVMNIIKRQKKDEDSITDAWIYKTCPNPRLVLIHFGDKSNWAKCVVKAGAYNIPNKPLRETKIKTKEKN